MTSNSRDETIRLAERLGRTLRLGDFVAMNGPLGAGKTTFAKGLALGLGVSADEPIISPTFVLIREYAGRLPLFHADIYRLGDGAELAELGIDEMLQSGVVLMEWADKFPDAIPAHAIRVELVHAGVDSRKITIENCPFSL